MKYPAETFVFLLGSILLISSLSFVAPSTESRMPTDPIDYEFFRPKYHVIAKKNWLNDPCAPFFNGTHYHLFYQYNPYDTNWGNMSWGHVSSPDLIHWKDEPLIMTPDQVYDSEGVFSGSSLASGFQGLPTIMYTAVSKLPISWKSDYNRGSEKQALAISHDGGHSWEKMSGNPVISAPPLDVNVSGWRDPYLFRSDTFEEAYAASRSVPTHADSKAVFVTISGGDKDAATRGGRLFLYRSTDFVNWAYVGVLFARRAEDKVGGSSAHFGTNFEVANVFSIPVATKLDLLDRDKVQNSDSSHDLERLFHIVVGSEGARYENGKEVHDTHWPLWASGKIVPDSVRGIKFEMISSGVADWGTYYAANSFEDPRTKRRLIFGWSNDENEAIRKAQGWGGILTMPREHIVVNYHRVTNFNSLAFHGALTVVASEMKNGKRIDMLRTLGSRPIQEMTRLRQNWFVPSTPLTSLGSTHRYQDIGYTGAHYEIHAQFQFPLGLNKGRYGFVVRASADGQERTAIYFDLASKRIIVNKSRTSSNKSIDSRSEWGNFELLTVLNAVDEEERETLDLRIFVDNSIIEIFANDRFALTARVNPMRRDAMGVYYYADSPRFALKAMNLYPMELLTFKERPRTVFINPKERFDLNVDVE